VTDKLVKKKYDPIARKHVEFREAKVKYERGMFLTELGACGPVLFLPSLTGLILRG
jgi:Ribosomal protein L33